MKRKFIIKGIVFPLCAALFIGTVFFAGIKAFAGRLFPVPSDSEIAYHDTLELPDKAADDLSAAKRNDIIGSISCNGELTLRLDADYSALKECASLNSCGVIPGNTGCSYIKLSANNVSKISTSNPIVITLKGMEYNYKFTGEKLVNSENEALSLQPAGKSTLVIYYRVTKGIGLTSDYYALMYKGVD